SDVCSSDLEIRGIATASNMFMRSIGSAVGVALLGGVLNGYLRKNLENVSIDGKQLTINMVDTLLQVDEESKWSNEVGALVQITLSNGLQKVYFYVFVIACISAICISFLPKQKAR